MMSLIIVAIMITLATFIVPYGLAFLMAGAFMSVSLTLIYRYVPPTNPIVASYLKNLIFKFIKLPN